MIIEIPDELDGSQRKRLLTILPMVYALKTFKGGLIKAANWLGLSLKEFKAILDSDNDLRLFLPTPLRNKARKSENSRLMQIYEDRLPEYITERDPLRKIRQFHLRRIKNTFWFWQLSEEKKREVLENIRKLY